MLNVLRNKDHVSIVVSGSGIVVASTYANGAAFIAAAEATTTAVKGHAVAWTDGTNTFVAEWNANTTANTAQIVELVGVTGITAVGGTGAGLLLIA